MPIHPLLVVLPFLLVAGGGAFLAAALMLGLRAVRALERRGASDVQIAALGERVKVLEDTLEAQSEEMRRLADGVQFTERLLTERGTADHGSAGDGRVPNGSRQLSTERPISQ